MLLTVMPGVRELRLSFTTGAMWLGVLWLAWLRPIPDQDWLTDAVNVLGVGPSLGILAFTAYWLGEFWLMLFNAATALVRPVRRLLLRLAPPRHFHEVEQLAAPAGELRDLLPGLGVRAPTVDELSPAVRSELGDALELDLRLGGQRLLGDFPEVHAQYDRHHAEYELRRGTAVPMLFLLMSVAGKASEVAEASFVFWVLAPLAAVGVWRSARGRLRAARGVIVDAIRAEQIPAPALTAVGLRLFGPVG